MSPLARSVQAHDLAYQPQSSREAGVASFGWSHAKLRYASFVLLGVAMPAAIGMESSVSAVRWLCLAWLLGVAMLMHGLSRRAAAETTILSIDRHGIWDRRLMSRCIAWHEIAALCPVDSERSCVVDLELRRPEITLAETGWWVRIGAHCQSGYDVPAVTISMLLLEGTVSDLLGAVALYRPELLHAINER